MAGNYRKRAQEKVTSAHITETRMKTTDDARGYKKTSPFGVDSATPRSVASRFQTSSSAVGARARAGMVRDQYGQEMRMAPTATAARAPPASTALVPAAGRRPERQAVAVRRERERERGRAMGVGERRGLRSGSEMMKLSKANRREPLCAGSVDHTGARRLRRYSHAQTCCHAQAMTRLPAHRPVRAPPWRSTPFTPTPCTMSRRRRRRQRVRVLGAPDDTLLEPRGPSKLAERGAAAAASVNARGRGRQRPRLPPLERKAAETRVREMHIRNYLRHQPHAALRREVSKERRQQLAQAFAALDADNSGSINMAELEVAAKALGFGPKKRARLVADAMAGDQDQNGQLSLEEFVRLIAEGAGDAGGLGADAFPFGLMAETIGSRASSRATTRRRLQKEEEAGTLLRRLSHKGGERRARPRPVERKAKAGGWLQVLEEQASPTGPGARRRASPR